MHACMHACGRGAQQCQAWAGIVNGLLSCRGSSAKAKHHCLQAAGRVCRAAHSLGRASRRGASWLSGSAATASPSAAPPRSSRPACRSMVSSSITLCRPMSCLTAWVASPVIPETTWVIYAASTQAARVAAPQGWSRRAVRRRVWQRGTGNQLRQRGAEALAAGNHQRALRGVQAREEGALRHGDRARQVREARGERAQARRRARAGAGAARAPEQRAQQAQPQAQEQLGPGRHAGDPRAAGALTAHHDRVTGMLWDRSGSVALPGLPLWATSCLEDSSARQQEAYDHSHSNWVAAWHSKATPLVAACADPQACDLQCCVGAGPARVFSARRQPLSAAAQQPRAARPAAGWHACGWSWQQSAGGVAASAAGAPGGRACCGSRQCTSCYSTLFDLLHVMYTLCSQGAMKLSRTRLTSYSEHEHLTWEIEVTWETQVIITLAPDKQSAHHPPFEQPQDASPPSGLILPCDLRRGRWPMCTRRRPRCGRPSSTMRRSPAARPLPRQAWRPGPVMPAGRPPATPQHPPWWAGRRWDQASGSASEATCDVTLPTKRLLSRLNDAVALRHYFASLCRSAPPHCVLSSAEIWTLCFPSWRKAAGLTQQVLLCESWNDQGILMSKMPWVPLTASFAFAAAQSRGCRGWQVLVWTCVWLRHGQTQTQW